jgi:membrane-bound serine protease (ClpP class)
MKTNPLIRFLFPLLLLLSILPLPVAAQSTSPLVLVLTADGPISSAMAEYLGRGLRTAEARGAELVVLQLDTPGGGVEIMTTMVQAIRASRVPVVVYVTPRGATAASAGSIITMAGHAAAMAPETVIGAASPVGSQGEDLGATMQAKVKEDLKANVRTLTERRGPQAVALAESMIDSAKAATATEALQVGLVDFIATDLSDLLRQMDGFTVQLESGERTLHTAYAQVVEFNPSFIERLLWVLTNPNIIYLLMQIGLIAILIEISSPGGWVSGTIGVVFLALGLYGVGVLNANWFGFVFIVLAFVLFIIDIKATTHGALSAAAVASLIAGSLVLFNSPGTPAFQRVSVPLVVGTSILTGALFLGMVALALRAQSIPKRTGFESMVGRTGLARGDLSRSGIVQLGGEQWSAELAPGEPPLSQGDRIQVVEVKGLRLIVRKATEPD